MITSTMSERGKFDDIRHNNTRGRVRNPFERACGSTNSISGTQTQYLQNNTILPVQLYSKPLLVLPSILVVFLSRNDLWVEPIGMFGNQMARRMWRRYITVHVQCFYSKFHSGQSSLIIHHVKFCLYYICNNEYIFIHIYTTRTSQIYDLSEIHLPQQSSYEKCISHLPNRDLLMVHCETISWWQNAKRAAS